ncbi:MAG TPA: nuclear transport factor 2 family protein, partial [Polyangiaceae bacterium]|nr:nuclear transport factor 2 family protein [Polyangiaceae bacterium]
MSRALFVLLAFLLATACKSKALPVTERTAAKVVTNAAPRPSPMVREGDVKAVLDKWLHAQKTGDFAAYSALYAERFQGIKRVGARTQRYDRKGWLEDRSAMFERPMKVEISDVVMQTTCCLGSVRFIQSWSSATFQDQGTKEILMVPGPAGLQISGEEMLISNVARAGKLADLKAKDIRLVVHAKHSYVVLGAADRNAAGQGPIVRDDEGQQGVVTTRQLLSVDSLPPDIKATQGMAMQLYGAAGAVCSAKLGEIFLLHRVTPHFGTVQTWNGGAPGDANPGPPMPQQEIAQAAWDEGADGALYAAEIIQTEGDCGTALWARETGRPEPTVFRPEPPSAELENQLEEALHAVAGYQRIAEQFA